MKTIPDIAADVRRLVASAPSDATLVEDLQREIIGPMVEAALDDATDSESERRRELESEIEDLEAELAEASTTHGQTELRLARLEQAFATERALRAQAEGRYESAAEMVERERERAVTLRETAQALCDAIEQAERRADSKGGQQCAPSCDFARVAPSTRRELRWWAARLREAMRDGVPHANNPGVGTRDCNRTSCNRGDHAGDCQRCMEVDRG